MTERETKTGRAPVSSESSGGLVARQEFRRSVIMMAGYLLVACIPKRKADGVFEWVANKWRAKFAARLHKDPVVGRIELLIGADHSEALEHAKDFHEWRMEDLWARWQASRNPRWQIQTEVVGLAQVTDALEQGRGVVFWGMSSCGTLFPKMALANAGVSLTQLSTMDHGVWSPMTVYGKRIAGPLHCLPEDRYLSERIRIPVDENSSYLYRLGKTLKARGCVWIAAERSRARKRVAARVLNRVGRFPMGAPVIALRNKAVLLTAYTERMGRFHYRLTIEAPIELDSKLQRKELTTQAVQQFAERLTQHIRSSPGDWDWEHQWARELSSEVPEEE